MFQKILIANRGEIACRVIRACREMGIQSVAIYSQADAASRHVLLADEAICVGEATNTDSYLNLPNVLAAVEATGWRPWKPPAPMPCTRVTATLASATDLPRPSLAWA